MAVAHEVDARVADVSDNESRLGEKQGRHRAAHAQLVALGPGSLVYGAVGIAQSVGDPLVRFRRLQIVQVREVVAHHLHRHLARDLAGRVPTHPVRDYE